MSTFFTNLINRSLASHAEIAPRPVSRFEPVSLGAAFAFERMGELEQAGNEAEQPGAPEAPALPANIRRETAAPPQTTPMETRSEALLARPVRPIEPPREDAPARSAAPVVLPGELYAAPSTTPAPPMLSTPPRMPATIPRTLPDLPQSGAPVEPPHAPRASSVPDAVQPAGHGHAEPPARQIVEREVIERITTRERLQPIIEEWAAEQRVVFAPTPQPAPTPESVLAAAPQHATPPEQRAHHVRAEPSHEEEQPTPPYPRQQVQQAPSVTPRPREATRPALAIQPRIEPLVVREPFVPQRAEPVPAPVIQVTIGRIDVRATPTAAAARQRSEPAVMSLDEYLRRRSHGGGR